MEPTKSSMELAPAFYRRLRIDLAGISFFTFLLLFCLSKVSYESTADAPIITISLLNGASGEVLKPLLQREQTLVSVQDVSIKRLPGVFSISMTLPEFSNTVYVSHLLKERNAYVCGNVSSRHGFENSGPALTPDHFRTTNLLSLADQAPLVAIDVSDLPYLRGGGPIIECDLDVKPLAQSIDQHTLAFVNHRIPESSVSQLPFDLEYNQIHGASAFANDNEVLSHQMGERITTVNVGGFVSTTWTQNSQRTMRDVLLVLAGAFAAFVGTFAIDACMLLNDNVDRIMRGKRLF